MKYDEFGFPIKSNNEIPDTKVVRIGIANAIESSSKLFDTGDSLSALFDFLIGDGAFGDQVESVRSAMLNSALAVIKDCGKTHIKLLTKIFDEYMSQPDESTEKHDRIREAVVICLGTVAGHLSVTDKLVPTILDKLLEALKTPSEVVQLAVANCLSPLIKLGAGDISSLTKKLLNQLFQGSSYGERRGAAYGIAAVVKGKGISALKEYEILESLKSGLGEKKNFQKRESALFVLEALGLLLGRLFEPYFIQILPLLLECFGDSHQEVREATRDATKTIMTKLSGHCVKLVLPSLLAGSDDKNWRTKAGSVELLGSMAFCAPKQLGLSLPVIVPRICEALTDSHSKVQEAAKTALVRFASVINNPEIQSLVPSLLSALIDPNKGTAPALASLLDTPFTHYIDAPSLAIVIPVLERGLGERITETKKMASQIVGSMANLTSPSDLQMYLPNVLPGLKENLGDPVPEARAIAARSLGSLVEKLGEPNFPQLINELLQILTSEESRSVDRFGAAQGLSEVIGGLGVSKLQQILPDVISNSLNAKSSAREGFITLLIYLPMSFGSRFQPYLGPTIPCILKGLADEADLVRDASLQAAQMIVKHFATSAVDLLLPELELALLDANWRIRQSSVQLIGDLISRLSNRKPDLDSDSGEVLEQTVEAARHSLVNSLGLEKTNGVLARIYIARNDTHAIVRQASLQVWKSLVSNTPRTLKDLLPYLMKLLINDLANNNFDRRQVAGQTMGDLVRKLGENILSELIPLFKDGINNSNSNTRQGVCIAICEIMASTGKTHINEFALETTPIVLKGLIDSESNVREAAAKCFDYLHQTLGSRATDEILPQILNEFMSGGNSKLYALEALKEMIMVRSNLVFPALIPTLTVEPISVFNARALGSLISVAGSALNKRIDDILPPLLNGLTQNDEATVEIETTITILLEHVDADGMRTVMDLILDLLQSKKIPKQISACQTLILVCKSLTTHNMEEFLQYTNHFIGVLLDLFLEKDPLLLNQATNALGAVVKSIPKDQLERNVKHLRKCLANLIQNDGNNSIIHGFTIRSVSKLMFFYLFIFFFR